MAVSNYLGNIRGKNRKVSKDPITRFEVACRSFDEWDIIDENEKKEIKLKEAGGKIVMYII